MSVFHLSQRQRWTVTLLSVAGISASATVVFAFVLGIVDNSLPWVSPDTIREHYLAVGDSFSQGFLAGFFLCFFMTLIAFALGSWVEERRVVRANPPIRR